MSERKSCSEITTKIQFKKIDYKKAFSDLKEDAHVGHS